MGIEASLIRHIESLIKDKIRNVQALSGGDINDVYLLIAVGQKLVVKINDSARFPEMFAKEASGLETLRNGSTFTIPVVLYEAVYEGTSFLLLSYIEATPPASDFWIQFGHRLAALHQNSHPYFGLDTDNYIGSLPQYNKQCATASDFYITQRLEPQFRLAARNGFSFSNVDSFYKNCTHEIPNEPPSLLHGDLWSGNYMIDANGSPCLLDPAVAYAPREMDIAMMHLFGGFDQDLFTAYQEIEPLVQDWKKRLPIWQLYYVLVHVNLFGSSYVNQAKEIIRQFS